MFLCWRVDEDLFDLPLGKSARREDEGRLTFPVGLLACRRQGAHRADEGILTFSLGLLACRRQGARRVGENYRTLISLAALASFPLGKLQLSRAACLFQAAN